MQKVLVVVDYQNDFVDGALGFPAAAGLEQGVAALVRRYLEMGDRVIFTLDTHDGDYLYTREGRALPSPHCMGDSHGWRLYGALAPYMDSDRVTLLPKVGFGSVDFGSLFTDPPEEITLVGVVTNMCVISNAVTLQALFPNAEITIKGSLCASFNEDLHHKSLEVMAGLQMRVE